MEGTGAFCSFCGAKLPDNIHRSEIRIENVAELERLRYEKEQAEIKAAQAKADRKKKIRNKLLTLIGQLAIPAAIFYATKRWLVPMNPVYTLFGYTLAGGFAFIVVCVWFGELLKK